MLIIRRKAGESILIGSDIEIEVVEVSAGRVKLGIHAPPEVFLLRKEIRLAEEQNLAAARGFRQSALPDLLARLHRPRQ